MGHGCVGLEKINEASYFLQKVKIYVKNEATIKNCDLVSAFCFLNKDWSTDVMKERWMALWVKRENKTKQTLKIANWIQLYIQTIIHHGLS